MHVRQRYGSAAASGPQPASPEQKRSGRSPAAALAWAAGVPLAILVLLGLLFHDRAYNALRTTYHFTKLPQYGLCVPRYTLKRRQYDIEQRALQLAHISKNLGITLPFTTFWEMQQAARAPFPATPPATRNTSFAGGPPRIGIVSLYSQAHLAPLYSTFANHTIANLARYAARHRYNFTCNTSHLLHNDGRDAHSTFWGKVVLVKHFLPHFDWLLWTDLDVLILEQQVPLHTFLRGVPRHYHVVAVLECGRRHPKETQSSVSSGFFFLRNSPEALAFVHAWLDLLPLYQYSPMPDQEALLEMFGDPMWKPYFYVYPSFLLSCYSECYDPGVFSVHFANTQRKECIPQWVDKLRLPGGGNTTRG